MAPAKAMQNLIIKALTPQAEAVNAKVQHRFQPRAIKAGRIEHKAYFNARRQPPLLFQPLKQGAYLSNGEQRWCAATDVNGGKRWAWS